MHIRKKISANPFLGVLCILALLVVIFAGYVLLRAQKSLRPAPESAPAVETGDYGIPQLSEKLTLNGLSNVWDLAFLPDKTLLFTERKGEISKVANGQKQVIHTIHNVYARGEGGLLGLAVDPSFKQNRFIYACYTTEQDVRVSRWKVNNSQSALSGREDIVTGIPVNTRYFPGRHSGCRLNFGADANLWIGTGDAAGGTNPQDRKSLGGKILRVDRNGTGVSGNLRGEFDNRIFSYGHRNVQGLALFDRKNRDSFGFSIEHGPDKNDELNQLVPGNMGWNPVPLYNELVSMTDKEEFPDAHEAVWNSGDTTIAPSGMTFIKGSAWRGLEGMLAVAVLKNEHVRLFKLNNSGTGIVSEKLLFENKYGRIRSVIMGPENTLYLSTDNGDGRDIIVQISPS